MAAFVQLGSHLADLFFPPRCVGCASAGSSFCPHCAQSVLPISGHICAHCGRPQLQPVGMCRNCRRIGDGTFSLARVATLYADPLRSAIHTLKYGGQPELAAPLARYLVAVAQQPPWRDLLAEVDGVVPVPLHSHRLAERGYNQSALLAGAFAKQMGLNYADNWLNRMRQTQPQVGLSAVERQKNVTDAFHAGEEVVGKRLLLIDDVFTTGATLAACAQALVRAGAEVVYGLILSTPAPTQDGSFGDS